MACAGFVPHLVPMQQGTPVCHPKIPSCGPPPSAGPILGSAVLTLKQAVAHQSLAFHGDRFTFHS